jgi:ribosomal protein L40E
MGAGDLFPEVKARRFERIFICRRCGIRIRADPMKVRLGKVKCRKCKGRNLRPIKAELKLGK